MPQTMPEPTQHNQPNDREVLVRVENVSKKFCRDLKKSLWYGVQDVASELVGRKYEHDLRPDEFWAVKDVSFELRRGECLGLIGHNGAGKTTLLKMLNGLIKPDQGRIEMNGRVGALIALGTGFNPILTGRENIYVNASILGISKREIDAKIDDIIDFAEIGDFIDTPVQNYSSGMQVRLGFAVAVNMNPDILLIDEVLAVGDVGFKQKAYAAIYEIIKRTAVIFVSHSTAQVGKVCNRGILMRKGEILFESSSIGQIIDCYFGEFKIETKCRIFGTGKANLAKIQVYRNDSDLEPKTIYASQNDRQIDIKQGESLKIRFYFDISPSIKSFHLGIGLKDMEMKGIAQAFSINRGTIFENKKQRQWTVELFIPQIFLNKGVYEMAFYVFEDVGLGINGGEMICLFENAVILKISSPRTSLGAYAIQMNGLWKVI